MCACKYGRVISFTKVSPSSPSYFFLGRGDKNNLAKRDIHIHTHSCIHNPPLTPRPGNWLGAAEPCYATHTHTNTHTGSDSHFLEPGYLPVHQDELCKPSTGMWGAWRSNLSNISCILSLSISAHLAVFIFFLLHIHALFPPLILFPSLFIPLLPHTPPPHPQPPNLHHLIPTPPSRRHHRGFIIYSLVTHLRHELQHVMAV